jgi:amidase
MHGSPLGVGSDIGGYVPQLCAETLSQPNLLQHSSVRIPSAFCGIYALRPSCHRVPYAGASNSLEGQDSVASVLGPMAGSLSGVRTFMRTIIDSRPWTRDPMTIRKPWDEDAYRLAEHGRGGRMCFAFMWHDSITVPHPPVTRAMEIVKAALLAAGHEVIDWQPLKIARLHAVLVRSPGLPFRSKTNHNVPAVGRYLGRRQRAGLRRSRSPVQGAYHCEHGAWTRV